MTPLPERPRPLTIAGYFLMVLGFLLFFTLNSPEVRADPPTFLSVLIGIIQFVATGVGCLRMRRWAVWVFSAVWLLQTLLFMAMSGRINLLSIIGLVLMLLFFWRYQTHFK